MSSISDSQSMEGTVLEGKYLLERELGAGGMGQVFLAKHTKIDREVAIKLLHRNLASDESVRRRFETEAKAIARLRHPNCVMLYEFGFSDEIEALFAVFEYVAGDSLEKWVGRQLPVGDIIELGRQVADGIEHAHSQKIIHRDLKPDNIMVVRDQADADEAEVEVKVLDFGIARITEGDEDSSRLTQIGQMFGTPPYMSPEQIRAKLNVTFATDIYSIGVILYEMTEGRLPFLGETPIETVMMHLNEEVPPMVREGVPQELRDIIMRCLEKNAEDRFGSCKKLSRALGAVEWDVEGEESMLASGTATRRDFVRAEVAFGATTQKNKSPVHGEEIATAETLLDASGEYATNAGKEAEAEPQFQRSTPTKLGVPDEPAIPASASSQDTTGPALWNDENDRRIDTLAPQTNTKKRAFLAIAVLAVLIILVGATIMALSGSSTVDEGSDEEVAMAEADPAIDDEFPGEDEISAVDFIVDGDDGLDESDEIDDGEIGLAQRDEEDDDGGAAGEADMRQPPESSGASVQRDSSGSSTTSSQQTTQQRRNTQERTDSQATTSTTGSSSGSNDDDVVEIDSPAGLRLDQRRRGRDEEEEESSAEEEVEEPAGLQLRRRN